MTCWYVYVVRASDNSLYCGITTEPERRIQEHNTKRGAKSLRGRLPVSLVFTQKVANKSAALRWEYAFKQKSKAAKEDFLRASSQG